VTSTVYSALRNRTTHRLWLPETRVLRQPAAPGVRVTRASLTAAQVIAAIGAILLVAAALRLYRLGAENFWLDEVLSVDIAAQPLPDIVRNYQPDTNPASRDQAPLSFVLTHFFLRPANLEWTARVPSALFGIATVLALIWAASELFSVRVVLLAGLLLALSPIHVWYSQEVRWYAQWVCLATLSYVALLRAWRTGSTAALVVYALCMLAAVYTFVFSFFVMASQLLSAFWLRREPGQPRRCQRLLLAQAAIGLAALPVVWWMIATHFGLGTGADRSTPATALPYTAFAYAVGFTLGPPLMYLHAAPPLHRVLADYPAVAITFACFLPPAALGVRALRRDRRAAAVMVPWLFLTPAAVLVLSLLPEALYNVRYTLVSVPAFLLVLALGLCSIPERLVALAFLGAVLACSLVSLHNYYTNPAYAKEDVRAATRQMAAGPYAGAPVLVVGEVDAAVRHYAPTRRIIPTTCEADAPLSAALQAPAVWLLRGRDWQNRARGCAIRLQHRFRTRAYRHFAGVDLWLYAPATADGGSVAPAKNRDR